MDFEATFFDTPARMKKKHKKTRTGCVTCKLRRVKCDEKKPICDRCNVLDKHCFYRPVPQRTYRGSSDEYDLDTPSPVPLPELALSPIERTQETAQLQQFCMNTSLAVFKNLGRPFETFWTSAVPKLSFSEPCVAHIMVALAARQRASFYVSNASLERGHLIKVYNRHYMDALRLLVSPSSRARPEMVLLCCLMFISMENVEDTVSNSFLHLRSGLQVLREWKSSRTPSTPAATTSGNDLIERTLEPMFARFEAAVSPSIYDSDQKPATGLEWPMPELPDTFENLATARGALYEIAQWVFSQGHHQMVFHKPHSSDLLQTLELCMKWRDILNRYGMDHPIDREKYRSAVLALETNHQLLVLLIKCTTLPNELLWGAYSNMLEEILCNIEAIEEQGPSELPQRRSKMNILPRMMPALFTVAVISRRRATQKRAVELIKHFHAENHKDQCFVAVIAEGCIQLTEALEQKSVMQLSSMDSRIRPLMAELVPGWPGKILLTYTRPFVRPLIADDPELGPIIAGAPKDTIELPWRSTKAPPARIVNLWPVIEFLRLSGSSGLVGPNTGHCLCKTYGALFALMR
ncbi:hypothetical protein LTR70_001906 [Exophiala xenobiotica]|uniref:Zn(2)-C6 fungal-type domain-containing protein n=1 Tax=Lithohypha guttulata TaxID=1690604 RepID=A0ABR0KA84_9EURO|nr:hypothetical protein LTR24_005092 [Lithohypha guttulata]KAK5326891.1 hypothetical protein LTR70_001906 [Exophiala xenobiotica]